MEKTFESIGELVKDPYFVNHVKEIFNNLIKQRVNRPEPKPGYRYKRDWYDQMGDEKQLHTDFFLQNIEAIWNKKSPLTSVRRRLVQYVCDNAVRETWITYGKMEEKAPEPAEKPKATRKRKVAVLSGDLTLDHADTAIIDGLKADDI